MTAMDKNYVNRTITAQEELQLVFGYHWTYFMTGRYMRLFALATAAALIPVVAVVASAFLLTSWPWWYMIPSVVLAVPAYWFWWSYITSDVRIVTSKRIIFKQGFLSRSTNELKLSAIEAITVEQSIWGRILRVGTLNIIGRGDGNKLRFVSVKRPIRTKHAIESIDWREDLNG
jgi:uncharacterized membrane protein YdbT with pleckstrin-like domain